MSRQDIEQLARDLGITIEEFQQRLKTKLEAAGLIDKGSADWLPNPSPQTTEGVPVMRFGVMVDPRTNRMHVYALNWKTGDYIPLEDDSPTPPRDREVVAEQDRPLFVDCHALTEDQRIELIAKAAVAGQIVNFIVEDHEKADRYVSKLVVKYPVKVFERFNGPANTVCVKVGPSKAH